MLPKVFHLFSIAMLMLLLLAVAHMGACGPLPRVNEQQMQMSKIPQWHCLRYFKHDLHMMRRCRHLRVPTVPRLGEESRK